MVGKFKIKEPADLGSGERFLIFKKGYLLAVSSQGVRGISGLSFKRVVISIMRVPPSWPDLFPTASSPKTITSGIRFQHMHLGRGTDI